jgi:hypothetical protein
VHRIAFLLTLSVALTFAARDASADQAGSLVLKYTVLGDSKSGVGRHTDAVRATHDPRKLGKGDHIYVFSTPPEGGTRQFKTPYARVSGGVRKTITFKKSNEKGHAPATVRVTGSPLVLSIDTKKSLNFGRLKAKVSLRAMREDPTTPWAATGTLEIPQASLTEIVGSDPVRTDATTPLSSRHRAAFALVDHLLDCAFIDEHEAEGLRTGIGEARSGRVKSWSTTGALPRITVTILGTSTKPTGAKVEFDLHPDTKRVFVSGRHRGVIALSQATSKSARSGQGRLNHIKRATEVHAR